MRWVVAEEVPPFNPHRNKIDREQNVAEALAEAQLDHLLEEVQSRVVALASKVDLAWKLPVLEGEPHPME